MSVSLFTQRWFLGLAVLLISRPHCQHFQTMLPSSLVDLSNSLAMMIVEVEDVEVLDLDLEDTPYFVRFVSLRDLNLDHEECDG